MEIHRQQNGDFLHLHCRALLVLIILLPGFAQSILAQNKIDYGNNPGAGKYYHIRGINMYCEIYGSGHPLLLLHGNGGSIRAFEKNIPYFSKTYRVIAPDSRAQGKSVDAGDSLSFEMMADDFAELLDSLQIDSAFVIGWSDGGIEALLLAMRHPEKVKKLVSTGANLWPDSTAFAAGVWQDSKVEYERSVNKTRNTLQEKNEWKLFLLDWNQPHITLADLKKIHCPAMIVCGDHDLISIFHTTLIFENIPNAYLWVVSNSSHGTLIDHADEFNRKTDDFFTTPFHPWK